MMEVANPFHTDKALLHREKLEALARGEMVAPQTIEVDLTDGACNQACVHCCFSSGEGTMLVKINRPALIRALTEAYEMGTRAVTLGGGGDPAAHPQIAEICEDIFAIGDGDMEVGLITNGLKADQVFSVAERLRFVRISLDTADPDVYQKLHQVPSWHFGKVVNNLLTLREIIPETPNSRQLGIAYLVVPPYNHQAGLIKGGAELAHELGLDYVTYRPVEDIRTWPKEVWGEAKSAIAEIKQGLRQVDSHTVAYGGVGNRWDTLSPGGHPTGPCNAKPLVAVIQSNGDIAECILYRNVREHRVGNIHAGSFKDQWFGEAHVQAWRSRQVDGCPNPCKVYNYNDKVRAIAAGITEPAPAAEEVAHHLFL